jgi:hypothetical protein
LKRRIAELAPRVERAFEFFARGAHPMTLVRRHLGSGGPGAEAWWCDASVELHVAAGAPDIARQKLPVDFFLSLAFSPEFKDAPFAFPNKPEEAIEVASSSHTGVASLVGVALRRPDLIKRLADAPLPPPAERRTYDDALRPYRAKLLQRVLDRKPYAELLEMSTTLDRRESVRWLAYFMSEAQAAELPKVLELADPAVREWYAALAAG